MFRIGFLGLKNLEKRPNKHYFDLNAYLMFVVSAPPQQTVTYVTSSQGTVGQSGICSCSNPLYPENNRVY